MKDRRINWVLDDPYPDRSRMNKDPNFWKEVWYAVLRMKKRK